MTATQNRPALPPAPRKSHRVRTAVLIVLGVVAFVAYAIVSFHAGEIGSRVDAARATAQSLAAAAPPVTVTAPAATAQPDGCLGGPDPHTAVLAAQQSAALTDAGAAEFALAIARWSWTYPSGDPTPLLSVMLDPTAMRSALIAVDREQEGTGDSWHLIHPANFGYHIVSNDGVNARVTVKVDRQYEPTNGQPVFATLTADFILTARDGHWLYVDNAAPSTMEPAAFLPYFGGCA